MELRKRRELRFYLDTSIWARLADPEDPRHRITWKVLRVPHRFRHLFPSGLVKAEIAAAPDFGVRSQVQGVMKRFGPRTKPIVARVARLAEQMGQAGCLGPAHLEDLVHIGYTVYWQMDILLTWDKHDLARATTRRRVGEFCRRRGLWIPRIETPEEVAPWLGVKDA